MTKSQAEELAAAMAQAQVERNDVIYQRQRQMKEEVAALQSIDDIRSYNVDWGTA